jgi:hypothetical protein
MIFNCLLYDDNSNFGYREYVRNLLFLFSNKNEKFLFRKSQRNSIDIFLSKNNLIINCIFIDDRFWRLKLLFLPKILFNSGKIIVHTFNYGPIFYISKSINILVIHDLQYKHKPFHNSFLFKLQRFLFLNHHHKFYDEIIFISNFSKYDYVLNFNLRNNLTVIPNYLPLAKYRPITKFEYFIDFNFILCVSGSKWYKRLDYLISEFEKFNVLLEKKSFRKFKLIIISNFKTESKDVLIFNNICQNQLNYLYSTCSAVVIPSFFEGFCFPYVESMIFNKKLFVYDMPISREITNGYSDVEYFDFKDGELSDLIYSFIISGNLNHLQNFSSRNINCFCDSNFQLNLYNQIFLKYI